MSKTTGPRPAKSAPRIRLLDRDVQESMRLVLAVTGGNLYGEAEDVRGLTAILVGSQYLDVTAAGTAYAMRLEYLKGRAMALDAIGLRAVVTDLNGLAFDPAGDGEECETDYENRAPIELRAHHDRTFLASLVRAGLIALFERDGSYVLRWHPSWDAVKKSGGRLQRCASCLYFDGNGFCEALAARADPGQGRWCHVFAPMVREESRGTYWAVPELLEARWLLAESRDGGDPE